MIPLINSMRIYLLRFLNNHKKIKQLPFKLFLDLYLNDCKIMYDNKWKLATQT